ncbi:DHS-like NAD/FAD-binding domain-containing protein [Xylaria nigripes]|nr:DHS-like NAD/FAD-binding domain-containing protein [Xylaria nigripes]
MPTLQITPDAPNLLQNVADTLAKSRKMVIITGAGISTNSGIPDFRSENGLYSLIQDQFEHAEVNFKKGDPQDHVIAAATSFDISDRPLKRRRMSEPDNNISLSATLLSKSLLSRDKSTFGSQTEPQSQLPTVSSAASHPGLQTAPAQQGQAVAVAPLDSSRRMTRSQATTLRPKLPRHLTQVSVDSSTSRESVFSDQPLVCEYSQTDNSTITDTPSQIRSCTPDDTPRRPVTHVTVSSPLSSPPPLFDPYESPGSSTDHSSHEEYDCSEISESDDTQQSSDFFSSKVSSSNLRNLKGRDLFDSNIWADPLKTSVFYRFITSLRQRVKDVQPTITHRFIAQMRDVGKLVRVYTQNIDEIEKKIGLSTDLKHGFGNKKRKSAKQSSGSSGKEEAAELPDDVDGPGALDIAHSDAFQSKTRSHISSDKGVECVFLHGSLHALRCFACGKLCDWDEDGRELRTLSGEQPECPHCAGATAARLEKGKRALSIGKLRPDVVLYGEEHPQSDLISPIVQHDLAAGPDLLLVLGTSLRVHGLKVMVKEFAKAVHTKGGKVIFINFSKPSESAWGDVLDYWVEWDCDAWVEDLKARKPYLWLSPDERLALDKQKRETLAERKRETLKKRESINEKKRDNPGDKSQQSSQPNKVRPPPKYPVAMRNDYHCGAYVVWDIFQTLAEIGDRPFDNLGYMPPVSLSEPIPVPQPPQNPNPAPSHNIDRGPQKEGQNQKKRNKNPRPRKPPGQGQRLPFQPPTSLDDFNPIPDRPSNTSGSSLGITVGTAMINCQTVQASTVSSNTDMPPTKRRKKARKSAAGTLIANVETNQEKKQTNINKHREKHTSKDQYLHAVRELSRSRKTPITGHPATANGLPPIPTHLPSTSEPQDLCPRPIPPPGYFVGQANTEHPKTQHSTLYPTQPWLLPPLPYSPLQPGPAPGAECPQGSDLPPLNSNWGESPPSILPMEIAPLVGPPSPLVEKSPSSNNPPYSYTWYHATQPIYNGPLMGISRQGIAHKSQWHMESNDDNTPSPTDQLHMEAANRLCRL